MKKERKINKSKLWENFYIKKQIEKREKSNGSYKSKINDCIRAMVYSYLSSQNEWYRVEEKLDEINDIFYNFNAEKILKQDPEKFKNALLSEGVKLGTQSTERQMEALFNNIEKLKNIQKNYENVSGYYDEIIGGEDNLEGYKLLVKRLSLKSEKYDDKIEQMGIALAAEYLRNLGYDIPKPDRHILRILGPEILGEHDSYKYDSDNLKIDVFDIIDKYAKATNKSRAEIDYLLWAYCANQYGEVCTKSSPKCNSCVIKEFCKKQQSMHMK